MCRDVVMCMCILNFSFVVKVRCYMVNKAMTLPIRNLGMATWEVMLS